MPKKILAFDDETSGIGEKFGLQQLAGIIYVDSKKVDQFNFRIKLLPEDLIDKKAIEVHGLDPEEGEEPRKVLRDFLNICYKYVDQYDKNDKFTPLGYNCHFDLDHTNIWLNKLGFKYFGGIQNWNALDPLPVLKILRYLGVIDLADLKLGTICNYFEIPIKAHDALSDIEATVKLMSIIMKEFKTIKWESCRKEKD